MTKSKNTLELTATKVLGSWIVSCYDCNLVFATIQSALKFVADYQKVMCSPVFQRVAING